MEGANILDLCVEGDRLIEEGTGAVYNKSVKGVKVPKGSHCLSFFWNPPLYQTADDLIRLFLFFFTLFVLFSPTC